MIYSSSRVDATFRATFQAQERGDIAMLFFLRPSTA
jgi:hypothetical protein